MQSAFWRRCVVRMSSWGSNGSVGVALVFERARCWQKCVRPAGCGLNFWFHKRMTSPRTPHVNLSGSEHGAARPHGIEPLQDLGRPGQFNIGESCLCETGCAAWGLLSLKRNSKHTALPEASRGLVTDVHPNWVWVFRVQDLIRQ